VNADIGYQKGAIFETGAILVLAFSKELDEKNVDHSLVAWWKDGGWVLSSQEDLTLTSICRGRGQYSSQTLFAGIYGEILIGTPSGMRRERLAVGKNAPNRLRTIHEVRAVGEHFIAVGMRRQVFWRHMGNSSWDKIDDGVFVSDESTDIAGFISVDGFNENEVYAVGHNGEIWIFDGNKWSQIESPTNLILNCVRCMHDGTVLICGDGGVILRGRRNIWTPLNQEITRRAITSLAGLGEEVFFVTEHGSVLALNNNSITSIEIEKGRRVTTGFLNSNNKSLLSVGQEDIYLYDGMKWQRLADPDFNMTS